MKGWGYLAVLFLAAGLMGACVPFSKEILRQVDPTLNFAEIQKDPQLYVGKVVLWGGMIVGIENQKDETLLRVMRTKLDYEKRPTNLDRSGGRFMVRYTGFLDPAIYQEGREITVVGEVAGKEIFPLGGIMYAYPVILAKEIRLWAKRLEVPYDSPPWFWAPYPPYWWYRYPY